MHSTCTHYDILMFIPYIYTHTVLATHLIATVFFYLATFFRILIFTNSALTFRDYLLAEYSMSGAFDVLSTMSR